MPWVLCDERSLKKIRKRYVPYAGRKFLIINKAGYIYKAHKKISMFIFMLSKRKEENQKCSERLYKGFVRTKDKNCIDKFKNGAKLRTFDEVKNLHEYAGILADDVVLVEH